MTINQLYKVFKSLNPETYIIVYHLGFTEPCYEGQILSYMGNHTFECGTCNIMEFDYYAINNVLKVKLW